MSKLWGGRFTEEAEAWVEEFGASISFDKQLVKQDIEGSIAHVMMLAKQGIVTNDEAEKIKEGLQYLLEEAKENKLHFSVEAEDVHLNIEKMLIEQIGEVGGKLHTGRDRNDQVATDMHLYLKEKVQDIINAIKQLQKVLVDQAEENIETIMPGYTHLQRAQPISFAHHILAYFWMLERDVNRYEDSLKRINVSRLAQVLLQEQHFQLIVHIAQSFSILKGYMKIV